MVDALREKLARDTLEARLANWGRWLRYDNTVARLGYPHQSPFVFSPRKGSAIADPDAEHMEWVITSLYVGELGKSTLYAFILRLEYAERPEGSMPPPEIRAMDVSRKFKRRCGRSMYYRHLENAKRLVASLAGPIVT